MSGVHDAFDDLLHAPWVHASSLLDCERMIGRLELHQWARWPRANLQYRLQ